MLVGEVKRTRGLLDEKDSAIRDLWTQLDVIRAREQKAQKEARVGPSANLDLFVHLLQDLCCFSTEPMCMSSDV